MSNKPSLYETTPVGRLVQGDLFSPAPKHKDDDPDKSEYYYICVAFHKSDTAFQALYSKMYQFAVQSHPQCFNVDGSKKGNYAFKIIDGDGIDDNGVDNKTKPGFEGHWVLRCSTQYPCRVYDSANKEIIDPRLVKRGYYVRVSLSITPNDGRQNKWGLFVSHNSVRVEAAGEEIVTGAGGIAPDVAFAAPVALPSGATAFVAGSIPAGPAMPPAPAAQHAMPPAPASTMVYPPQQGQLPPEPAPHAMPPQPAPFNAMAPGPVAQQPPQAASQPTSPRMSAKANGFTYEQLIAAGHTNQTLLAEGYFADDQPPF